MPSSAPTMKKPRPTIEDRGPGEPALAIVGGIHGDEPSGVRAVKRLLDADLSLQRGVRFVVANPPAVEAGERYLDKDLNRVFPGDPDSSDREERLAARLCAATDGLPTLSIHSTHSHSEPIALASPEYPEAFRLAAQLPTPYVVDETPAVDGAFTACSTIVTLEAGCQHTDEAAATAERQARAFLAVTGALDTPAPAADPSFYRMDIPVEKPPAESYSLQVANFEPVSEGVVYASTPTEDSSLNGRSFRSSYRSVATRRSSGIRDQSSAIRSPKR